MQIIVPRVPETLFRRAAETSSAFIRRINRMSVSRIRPFVMSHQLIWPGVDVHVDLKLTANGKFYGVKLQLAPSARKDRELGYHMHFRLFHDDEEEDYKLQKDILERFCSGRMQSIYGSLRPFINETETELREKIASDSHESHESSRELRDEFSHERLLTRYSAEFAQKELEFRRSESAHERLEVARTQGELP